MANDMVNLASAVNSSVVSGDMSGRKAAQAHSTEALVSKADVEKAQTSQTVQSAEAEDAIQKKESQRHEMEKQAQDLQEISDAKGWAVSFRVDDDLEQTIIKVVDSDTQKTIRQIPSEELVTISKRIKALREGEIGASGLQGLLFDRKA
ncbi:flagellar protein FlaG [Aeromonas caviae]|uniref:flagellar protein FlaG n=1 Tax=Aeromonas TaxID=642 RepID=UPI001F254170|nr:MULTISPECIES: flagellar protein FlaG [Aeromonas]MDH0475837.1 flagellar protein FlaG [Aeromonas caviae]